jgi:hypothetical protein
MNIEIKPSLFEVFKNTGDIREIIDLMSKYNYSSNEISEVINFYEPYQNNIIPEIEHIETLLIYSPNSYISNNTLNAINICFPHSIKHILKIKNIKNFK